jgi:hypothetical protein
MLKGLAMTYTNFTQDRTNLKVNWWYDWGINHLDDPIYVPMMRTGKETNLPQDYSGFCLLFNEPENPEPNGIGASVSTMVSRYKTVIAHHPKTRFVVGGVGFNNYKLLSDFKNKLISMKIPVPSYWHVHAYVYRNYGWTTSKIKTSLAGFKKLGGTVWVTEFGCPNSDKNTLPDFKNLVSYFNSQKAWIGRIAPYTNRQSGKNAWEIGKGCNLVDFKTGKLTEIGKYYSGI